MPTFGFNEEGTKRIVDAVRRIERQVFGAPGGNGPPGALDYPVPMFPAKLSAASSKGGSAAVVLWGATQASTGAETSLGTSDVAYDWLQTGGSSGQNVYLFRSYGSGRLYFFNGTPASSNLLPLYTIVSTATPAFDVTFRSTDGLIAAGVQSSVFINWLTSSAIAGYSTAATIQFLSRTSTGLQWTASTTCV